MAAVSHPDRFLVSLLLFTSLAASGPAQGTDSGPVYRWTTLAGSVSAGAEDGPQAAARFDNPHGLAFDPAGNLYVADTGNHTIRKVTPDGVTSIFAGVADMPGSSDGTGPAARFNAPRGTRCRAAVPRRRPAAPVAAQRPPGSCSCWLRWPVPAGGDSGPLVRSDYRRRRAAGKCTGRC